MKLGTMIGGKAWAEINDAARVKRQAAALLRKDEFYRKQRRESLNAAGFKALSCDTSTPRWV
jgi:hypothetical protein